MKSIFKKLQSWARVNFLASRQRQRDNIHNRASVKLKNMKNVKVSVSKCSSRHENRHCAIANIFVVTLSRAQL